VKRAFAFIAASLLVAHAAAADPEKVSIPAGKLSNSPAPLEGYVFGGGSTMKRPAVVMMHGCGGAFARDGSLNARHRMWGEYLAGLGYVVLMLDSFTSRGVREICTQKFADRSLKEADRVGDAMAALAWISSREGVDPARVALLGWSHGGGTVLATVAGLDRRSPRYAAAIAFYPGCTQKARHADDFHAPIPLLVLIGEADDWTPAAPCKALARAVAARGEPMEIVTYDGAYHDFDNPALNRKRVRHEVPNGVHKGEGVTTAPDPAAREDAKRRVGAFLRKNLGG
jgi:dienelactone hydrolase